MPVVASLPSVAVRLFTVSLLTVGISLSLTSPADALTITNGMAATLVLGQPNFTSAVCGVSQTSTCQTSSVAVDPVTGKVFVSDGNHRVLRYASIYSLTNGAAAEAVLGQANFTSFTAATTQTGMSNPQGIFADSGGQLWVADFGNSRVLRFDNAASKANGASADGVLGQPDFTSNAVATTPSGMNFPNSVHVDSGERLWVTDSGNGRVLRFDNAASKANGANANGVLGQLNFTSSPPFPLPPPTQSSIGDPFGVFMDFNGRLWVADIGGNRVLRFDNAASMANGANANGVLGQPDFTSSSRTTTQSGMWGPEGVSGDTMGRLYVVDNGNNRVLVFNNAAAKNNGGNSDNVLGHADFTTRFGGSTKATTLADPHWLFYDPAADVLWVGDGDNNRALKYGAVFSLRSLFLPLIRK